MLAKALRSVLVLASLALAGACGRTGGAPRPAPSSATSATLGAPAAPWVPGDAARGERLAREHECSRCHDGTGTPAPTFEKDCVGCHRDILDGKLRAPADKLAKWQSHVGHVRDVPTLASLGRRLAPAWIEDFLVEPTDVRPNLVPTMPRLGLSRADAKDLATWLVRDRSAATPSEPSVAGDLARGRALVESRACGACHVFTGVAPLPATPVAIDERGVHRPEVSLAPDLRFARARMSPEAIVRWLVDPGAIRPGTLMPKLGLGEAEARDVAAYLVGAPLAVVTHARPARLPLLDRPVTYAEVDARVLSRTCRHCHGDPDVSMGDGGPGNTSGFGFPARGVDVSSYRALGRGMIAPGGERVSLFAATADGTPRLVAALLARQGEEAGEPDAQVRGMPLGLPSLSPQEIQLVASWVAQGRPR